MRIHKIYSLILLLCLVATATQAQETKSKTSKKNSNSNLVTQEQFDELKDKVNSVVESQKQVKPNEFNPSIGLVGETVTGYRSKGSDKTGSASPGGFDFLLRSVELNIAASVDPFFKAWVVANASADPVTSDASFDIEEAALQSTSLPWNLTLTGGRFFGEFGKLSNIHDHELPFVNRPLALDQYVGGESRTDGVQLHWLFPTTHYISLSAGLGDSFGGDGGPNNPGTTRLFKEVNFFGRLSTYFDLGSNWQIETGVSGLINPSTDDRGGAITQADGVSTKTEKNRRLIGGDFKLSYVPLQNNQFKSLTWGTEFLYSDNKYLVDPDGTAANGDELLGYTKSKGLYSYLTYKWSRQWSAGFLFDFVENPQNNADRTFAYSPYLTFAISHWDQLRLQYTHTQHNPASGLESDEAVYLQWAWIIGSHSHGWAQR